MRSKKVSSYTQHAMFGSDTTIDTRKVITHQSVKRDRILTWSFGGGTQTIAIALLVYLDRLPKPDLTIFCDTGREGTETWEYNHKYVEPLLASIGITIEIASHDLATVDLYGHNGDLLLPAFTETGKFPTYCSDEWKKKVFRRYVRSKGIESCITWLGMSTDEVDRIKPSDVQWQEYQWPLAFNVPMSRTECRQFILNQGLPDPPKSSCWCCPHRLNGQWLRLKTHYPQDFQKAVEHDRLIRERDRLHAVYLHKSAQPLEDIDFSQPEAPALFGEENGGCQSGFCFV